MTFLLSLLVSLSRPVPYLFTRTGPLIFILLSLLTHELCVCDSDPAVSNPHLSTHARLCHSRKALEEIFIQLQRERDGQFFAQSRGGGREEMVLNGQRMS